MNTGFPNQQNFKGLSRELRRYLQQVELAQSRQTLAIKELSAKNAELSNALESQKKQLTTLSNELGLLKKFVNEEHP